MLINNALLMLVTNCIILYAIFTFSTTLNLNILFCDFFFFTNEGFLQKSDTKHVAKIHLKASFSVLTYHV